jgi:hypothetical protein
MNRPNLYERVAITRDIVEYGLKRGDVATLVDHVPHPNGGPDGLVLEVTNAIGQPLRVVTVTDLDVESLRADEVLAVRQLLPLGAAQVPLGDAGFSRSNP